MPEPVGTPEAPATTVDPATKAILDKYNLESVEKLDEVFGSLKNDFMKVKTENKTLSAEQVEYARLKAEAEERRLQNLSEVDLLKETLGTKDTSIADLNAKLAKMEKSRLQDKVLFTHSTGKALLGTRMKLYETAAKTQEWADAEELKAVFSKVDADFDAELKSMNINLPAPGDGSGGKPTTESVYDDKFFETFGK